MELNRDFFKAQWKTITERFSVVFRRADKATMEFLGRVPSNEEICVWLRENAFLKKCQNFFKALYTRLVVKGEYTRRDLIVLFVITFSAGLAWKTLATHFVTIGFDDYTLPPKESLLDLNDVQKKLTAKGDAFIENDSVRGATCSE